MRYFLFPVSLFFAQIISAQKSLPDSTMKEFARLTCECATLAKIDKTAPDKAIQDLGTCISSTVDIYEDKGWINKEWMDDSVWSRNFDNEMQVALIRSCSVFKTLLDKISKPADGPAPLPSVNEKYFLTKEWMLQKGLQADLSAGNANMKRWSATNLAQAKIHMVFDIRFIFKNEKDAAIYFKAKQPDLSEGGKLTAHSLVLFGASESKVYGPNEQMIKAFGDMDIAQYNFVFRIRNTVAKVFVSATKKVTYEEALAFAKEAIGRIKASDNISRRLQSSIRKFK